MAVDVYVFLVKIDGGYILVDAGGPTDEAAELLLKNLDEVMGDGKLKLIILTHGHPDHAGVLSSVAHAHPDAQIVFHEHEAPFILGVWPRLNIPLYPALFWSKRGHCSPPIGSGLSGLSFAGILFMSSSGIFTLHLILRSHKLSLCRRLLASTDAFTVLITPLRDHAGQNSYGDLPADSLAYKLFSWRMPPSNFSKAVPASRALLL